jgi:hypothetical protein
MMIKYVEIFLLQGHATEQESLTEKARIEISVNDFPYFR